MSVMKLPLLAKYRVLRSQFSDIMSIQCPISVELEEMIAKIEKKPLKKTLVRVELCRMSRSIEISNVSKHYDDEFLKMYFENHKKSGGGNVTSIDLLGGGKAIVTFEDPEGIYYYIWGKCMT